MVDVHDKKTRSYNMSRIRSEDTKPEIIVRKFLFANGFRYRLHDKKLPGKPDIVLPKYKTVVFVNGCFWHGHRGCKYFILPTTRAKWWKSKIETNAKRDQKTVKEMRKEGWKVITIWECYLKNDKKLQKLLGYIKNNEKKS